MSLIKKQYSDNAKIFESMCANPVLIQSYMIVVSTIATTTVMMILIRSMSDTFLSNLMTNNG